MQDVTVLHSLIKILFLPSMSKSLQFTLPISIISLSSESRDFSKVSISSIVWCSYFGGLYHAIIIKGLVHFSTSPQHIIIQCYLF